MPTEVQTVLSTTQFTGIADAGLFSASGLTGADQVYVRNLLFHFEGTAPAIVVTMQDPDTAANEITVFAATANDYAVMSGFWLPTKADGTPWDLKVTTTLKDDDGYMTIDWELRGTGE